MARVILKKDFAEDIIAKVNTKTEDLLETVSKLGTKLNEAKIAYNSDNSSKDSFSDMQITINKIISSYSSLNKKFTQTLREIIEEYSRADQKVVSNVNAVTAIPLAAGTTITGNSISNNMSNSATNANAGRVLDEKQIAKEYFEKEGTYTFEYRTDGSVKIERDGKPLAFTTKKAADDFSKNYSSAINMEIIEKKDDNKQVIFYSGEKQDKNVKLESFTDQAIYSAGKDYKTKNINYSYNLGIGTADNKDPNYQDRIKSSAGYFYDHANQEEIQAYERAIRDSSVDAKTAQQIINEARSQKKS